MFDSKKAANARDMLELLITEHAPSNREGLIFPRQAGMFYDKHQVAAAIRHGLKEGRIEFVDGFTGKAYRVVKHLHPWQVVRKSDGSVIVECTTEEGAYYEAEFLHHRNVRGPFEVREKPPLV